MTLEERRSPARKQYQGVWWVCEIAREAHKIGSIFVELSEKGEAWSQYWGKEVEALGAVTGARRWIEKNIEICFTRDGNRWGTVKN